ncbi:hypothetical protein [uncultured Bacteroides sp.]|uniref:hypothetical protein n=1 Tax=uncultured Bacteroides sp. TaxID=162156 RepID=UPI0025EBBB31|nr:hypothetical protein [uncultured Bacteroides sp.]
MRKSLFLLFIILAIWSCKNEVEDLPGEKLSPGTITEFVKLSDGNSQIAGTLSFYANESEVDVTWVSSAECNLDTTQTKVVLKDGKGVLPIRWLDKQSSGAYAPEQIAFKAWVVIKGDNYSKNIPLIWSEYVDTDALSQSIQTRANNTPRVSLIQFGPSEVIMDEIEGGWTYAKIQNISSVNLDYSLITTKMNVDLSNAPASFTESMLLTYPWISGTAPQDGFTALVVANAPDEGYASSFTLKYKDGGGDSEDTELQYQSNSMPSTGNLPATSNIYTFKFTGNYTGSVQLRTLSNGNVLYTAATYDYPANQPRARVPENTGEQRPIEFEYRKGTGQWMPISEANRIQDGQGTTPPQPGSPSYGPISPTGDIPDAGGDYNCVFSNYTGHIYFQAVSGQGRLLAETSDIIPANGFKQMFLTIPEAKSLKDNTVLFQYSTDGITWTTMETRTQIVEAFGSGYIHNLPKMVPATGGTYTYTSQGSLSGILTILCQDSKQVVLSESKGAAGGSISVVVPANNTGEVRTLFFYLKRNDQPDKAYIITHTQQSAE